MKVKGKRSKRVDVTLDVGHPTDNLSWCDMPMQVALLMNVEDAQRLLLDLMTEVIDKSRSKDIVQVVLRGRGYMNGKLPPEATTVNGESVRGVTVHDDMGED